MSSSSSSSSPSSLSLYCIVIVVGLIKFSFSGKCNQEQGEFVVTPKGVVSWLFFPSSCALSGIIKNLSGDEIHLCRHLFNFRGNINGGSYLMKGNFFSTGDKNLWTLEVEKKVWVE